VKHQLRSQNGDYVQLLQQLQGTMPSWPHGFMVSCP